MSKKDKFGTTRRDEAARWTSKEIGLSDFKEDYKLRTPGSFEKGAKPALGNEDDVIKLLEK